jgi:hypothetical protein
MYMLKKVLKSVGIEYCTMYMLKKVLKSVGILFSLLCLWVLDRGEQGLEPEPVFVNGLWSPGIDSEESIPLRREPIPGLLNRFTNTGSVGGFSPYLSNVQRPSIMVLCHHGSNPIIFCMFSAFLR